MNVPQWFPELSFGFIFLLLIALPFFPTWQEWHAPTDCASVAISRESANGVHFFSNRFRIAAFSEIVEKRKEPREGFEYARKQVAEIDWTGTCVPLIAFSDIQCGSDMLGVRPLYLKQNFVAGSGNRFCSLMAEGSIRVGNRTLITQWAHADGTFHLGAHSIAMQRLSSTCMVELDMFCCFERVTAPIIRFGLQPTTPNGHSEDATPNHESDMPLLTPNLLPAGGRGGPSEPLRDIHVKPRGDLITADFIDLPHAIQKTDTLFHIQGDCILRPGRIYRGSLIVAGKLWIGHDTAVIGDIKARDAIVIGPGAYASGSIVCEKMIEIQNDACIVGPVIAETDILLGKNACIGSAGRPTSMTAARIIASVGAVVYGSAWAHTAGVVSAA